MSGSLGVSGRDEDAAATDGEGVPTERDWLEGLPDDERNTGVYPCFAPCGQPACRKLGCVRVYNARNGGIGGC